MDTDGTDWVEFGRDELRISGGDYGTVVLEGLTTSARLALDALVAAARRGTGRVVVDGLVIECDDSQDLFEIRHAGYSGTPESGVGTDTGQDHVDGSAFAERAAATFARQRDPASGEG